MLPISMTVSTLGITLALAGCGSVFEEVSAPVTAEQIAAPLEHTPETGEKQSQQQRPDKQAEIETPPDQDFHSKDLDLTRMSRNFVFIDEKNTGTTLSKWIESLPIHGHGTPVASYDKSDNELQLFKNISLSFKSFRLDQPLTIRTNGHDIILAGTDLDLIHVDTTSSNSKSGSLFVFTNTHSSPTFRVEGEAGQKGSDGDCLMHRTRCIPVSDRKTRAQTPRPDISWSEKTLSRQVPWQSNFLSQEIKEKLIASMKSLHPDRGLYDLCTNSDFAVLDGKDSSYEGEVELVQRLKAPKAALIEDLESEQHAKLFEGTIGEHGQDSGSVFIIELGKERNVRKFPIPGGMGGSGGRNFKIAARSKMNRFTVESEILSEEIVIKKLKVRTVLSGRCAGEVGRPPQRQRQEFVDSLKQDTIQVSLGLKLSNDTLVVESMSEGADLPLDIKERQPQGWNGKAGSFLHLTLTSLMEWSKLVPLNLSFPE